MLLLKIKRTMSNRVLEIEIAQLFVEYFNRYMKAPALEKKDIVAEDFARRAINLVERQLVTGLELKDIAKKTLDNH